MSPKSKKGVHKIRFVPSKIQKNRGKIEKSLKIKISKCLQTPKNLINVAKWRKFSKIESKSTIFRAVFIPKVRRRRFDTLGGKN